MAERIVGTSFPGRLPFIGRQRELARLGARLADADAQQGSAILLTGEPGIGKSRLLEQFAIIARDDGALVLSGRSFDGEWAPPYGPFAEALVAYAASATVEELRSNLGQGAAALSVIAPVLRRILDLGEPLALPANEERFRLFTAMSEFLISLSDRSALVLAIDDLHWADTTTLGMFRHVARIVRGHRMVLIAGYRDAALEPHHPLAALLASLPRETDVEQLHLRGLHSEDARTMVHALAPTASQQLAQSIADETGGSPLFIRELVLHLVEEERLRSAEEQLSAGGTPGDWGIPASVRNIIERRVQRTSLVAQKILVTASAIGGVLQPDVLALAARLDQSETLDAIDEAIAAQLLRRTGDGHVSEFTHALIAHTLYDGMNSSRRTRLHRQIAEALAQGYSGPLDERAAEIAFQFHRSIPLAGAERGCAYALDATTQAQTSSAPGRAVEFLRIARDLGQHASLSTRAMIVRRLAIAEAIALMIEDASRSGREALALLGEAKVDAADRAHFLESLARALKEAGAFQSVWQPFAREGLELKHGAHDLTWARLILLFNPFTTISTGLIHAASSPGYDREAVAIAQSTGRGEDYVASLALADIRTREETDELRALVTSWQNRPAMLQALYIAGNDLLVRHGAFREARDLYLSLLAVNEVDGSIVGQAFAHMQLVVAHAALGSLGDAKRAAAAARPLLERVPATHVVQFSAPWVAFVQAYYLDGDWAALARTASFWASYLQPLLGAPAFAAQAALAYAHAGNIADALRYLEELTPLLERIGPSAWHQHVAVILAAEAVWEIAAEPSGSSGLVPLARRYEALARQLVPTGAGDIAVGSLALTIARMSALDGRYRSADFAYARDRATTNEQRALLPIIDYDEARSILAAGGEPERAHALLAASMRGFRERELEWWARRAERLDERVRVPARPGALTARETEVLRLIAAGRTNREIGVDLTLSVRTVARHITNIYTKIGARGKADATSYAHRNNLT